MKQTRRSPRVEISFPVFVEIGGEIRRHRAANVSEQGMMFLAREPYPVGTPCRVTFVLPFTDVEIMARAEVVHVTWVVEPAEGMFRVGLRFEEFESGETERPLMALPC